LQEAVPGATLESAASLDLHATIYATRDDLPAIARALRDASLSIWIARPPGSERRALGELLGDGMDPGHASLWRRQLVLGPAPEFCLLTPELPPGVGAERLPAGWTATVLDREVLWSG